MAEKDLNLDETIGTENLSDIDLSSVSFDSSDSMVDQSEINEWEFATSFSQPWEELDTNPQNSELLSDSVEVSDSQPTLDATVVDSIAEWIDNVELDDLDTTQEVSSSIDETLFLESEQTWFVKQKYVDKDTENFWKYIRIFFISSVLILLWLLAIGWFYSFDQYNKYAVKNSLTQNEQKVVDKYKDPINKVKWWFGMYNVASYQVPNMRDEAANTKVTSIVNAWDIDYVDKKNMLLPYVSDLTRTSNNNATKLDTINKEVAKQWFLPEELDKILSEDQAIDTIQRSLNALEVIKFSTATRVFSYMDTALQTISEMVRTQWVSSEDLRKLFTQLSSKWEKDISAYVYMCYLNPFETDANCDTIWDLDIYYATTRKNDKDKSDEMDLKLFKNSMNAINQLLEKRDTSLFSITFNGFNAQDKNITFNIEVFTNQSDEKSLMAQWKRNPNIFILTNIINLLKQSSFIIWSEINTKEVNVETRSINIGWLSTLVNYSSKDFTVPIQKDTEREIFDYIDLDGIVKMLQKEDEVEKEEMNDVDLSDEADVSIDEEEMLEWYWELLWVDVNDVDDNSNDEEAIDEEIVEYEPVFISDIEPEDDEWEFVNSND